jgi:CrcB protein
MIQVFLIGLGGCLGAILRYWLSGVVHRYVSGSFPYGTLVVNVLGCLVIGFVTSVVEYRQLLSPNSRLFLTIGLLGSLTTFSTLGYETFALLRENETWLALSNVAVSVVVGLVAVAAGWLAGKSV